MTLLGRSSRALTSQLPQHSRNVKPSRLLTQHFEPHKSRRRGAAGCRARGAREKLDARLASTCRADDI
eukprot:5430226-Pleurochrysis_carterae.AAC.2